LNEDLVVTGDKALPGAADAEATHPHFPRWNGIAPLPNARMMLHVGKRGRR
jgi:hypothetical protein